jgi:flagellar protein FliO/FliZ
MLSKKPKNKRWQQLLRFLTIFTIILISSIYSSLVPSHLVQAETDNKDKSVFDSLPENQTTKDSKTNEKDNTPTPLEEQEEVGTVDNQFGVFDFFNVIFALFLVLMLLYVTLRFIKKKNQTYSFTRTMMNLGGTSLGGNRSIQLVKIGDRVLILGVGEDIQLLKEIESKEEIERIISQQQNEVQQTLQPSDLISKLMVQVKSFGKEERKTSQDSFKSILSKQLSEISNGRKKILEELDRKGKQDNE